MIFVLTLFGENLFATNGIPTSLNYVLGNGVNYTPLASDINIHGTQVGSGTTLPVESSSQPTYPVFLAAEIVVPPFGEVALFYGVNLVALGTSTQLLQNTVLVGNLSILCKLPPVSGQLGLFSSVALSSQSGIDFLPSVDSLPRAMSILNRGTSNQYGFLGTDLTAMSSGQRWLLVGGVFTGERLIASSSGPTNLTISAALPGTPIIGDRYYISVGSGANAGIVRTATLIYSTLTDATFSFVVPWPGGFNAGDRLYLYTPAGSGGGVGGASLTTAVPVVGTSVGAVDAGYTFPVGTTFQNFVELVSTKTLPPVYTPPTMSINGAPAPTNYEVGTLLNILFSKSFAQNNGGAPAGQRLYKNSVLLSSTYPYTDNGVQMLLTPISYAGQNDYAQGPILNDNLGNPSPAGRINAGTVTSNTVTYVGQRLAFYGTPIATPTTGANVRALSDTSFNSNNNSGVDAAGSNLIGSPTPSFVITIPIGATRVSFAYPADRRTVASVRYQELSDSEVKANFIETSISVTGANGFSAVAYRVFTYVPVAPFSVANHYKVFI